MVADRGARGNGEILVKVTHFQLQDQLSSGDLIYSQMTLVNDTVLHHLNLLRGQTYKCSHHKKKKKRKEGREGGRKRGVIT